MAKIDMPDIIVLLPGITGSQLRKNGKVVWGARGGTLAKTLLTRGGHMRRALTLQDDPADEDDLGDGVIADRLFPDLHMLPGFWKIDGYSKVSKVIRDTFNVKEGANYVEFPYDWRRDNRVAAKKLRRQSGDLLRKWRTDSGNDKARLILVAHSMGGLVARYFLEVLGGWKDSRALITFGTPFRGSLNALDTLVNGMTKGPFGLVDLSAAARSFTSIYQLLPIYRCYAEEGNPMIRLTEADKILNLDMGKVKAARAFHQEIQDAVKANEKEEAYRRPETSYQLYPFVGIAQETKQGARREGDTIQMLYRDYQEEDRKGDGTVPRVSAVPPEYGDRGVEKFSAVKHGSMQNGGTTHTGLEGIISGLYFNLGDFLAPSMSPVRVALDINDVYLKDEPIQVHARPETPSDATLIAQLRCPSRGAVVAMQQMQVDEDGTYSTAFEPQPAGNYVVRIDGGETVEQTEDAFAVADVGEERLSKELEG